MIIVATVIGIMCLPRRRFTISQPLSVIAIGIYGYKCLTVVRNISSDITHINNHIIFYHKFSVNDEWTDRGIMAEENISLFFDFSFQNIMILYLNAYPRFLFYICRPIFFFSIRLEHMFRSIKVRFLCSVQTPRPDVAFVLFSL